MIFFMLNSQSLLIASNFLKTDGHIGIREEGLWNLHINSKQEFTSKEFVSLGGAFPWPVSSCLQLARGCLSFRYNCGPWDLACSSASGNRRIPPSSSDVIKVRLIASC